MKKTTILYWSITGLFAAFMIFTSIPNVMMSPEAVTFITHLGYPEYFIPFIGVAKILGSLGILLPGFPRIKEWAYAGLFFDLAGAFYSIAAVDGIKPDIAFMVLPFGLIAASYYLWHAKIKRD